MCLKHLHKLFRVFLAVFFGQITQVSSLQWKESQLSVHRVNSLSITPEAGSNHLSSVPAWDNQKNKLTLTLTPKTLLVLHWHHCRGNYPDHYLINWLSLTATHYMRESPSSIVYQDVPCWPETTLNNKRQRALNLRIERNLQREEKNLKTDAAACSQHACANSPGTLAAFWLHRVYFYAWQQGALLYFCTHKFRHKK